MRVKQLTNKIITSINGSIREYRTSDGTRIDIAIPQKNIAIEIENSYKWINRRVLYNAVKASRAGLNNLIIIYPFNKDTIINSWVNKFIKELGVKLTIIKPSEWDKLVLLTK